MNAIQLNLFADTQVTVTNQQQWTSASRYIMHNNDPRVRIFSSTHKYMHVIATRRLAYYCNCSLHTERTTGLIHSLQE